jgi:aminoglycoside phosphotransferase (APT) family kinase protein
MIYDDDLNAAAILDWEMMSLASPELDVAFLTFAMRMYTEGMGIPRPEGFPDRETIVARYEASSGYTVRHLDFYEMLNAVRAALIIMRLGRLMIEHGQLPRDATMPHANPASQILERLLKMEGSGRAVQSWTDAQRG